jgi:hypothetical protein
VIFQTTVQRSGKSTTGIHVPDQVVSVLGSGRRPAVRVTINTYPYRSTIAAMGGVFMAPVSAEVRERAAVAAGDEVEVHLELDTQPREVVVPPDLAGAPGRDTEAKRFFEGLSYSRKQRVVLPIEQAKAAETR